MKVKTKIIEIIKETEAVKSFRFEKPEGLKYIAGQYTELKLEPGLERDLTLSSSPTEKFLQITTMFHPKSEFKQRLWQLKIGDEVDIIDPKGHFVLDEIDIRERIFLAGGIGITPFRSMLKHTADKQLSLPTTLLYSVKNDEEAIPINFQFSRFNFQLIETSKDGRIDEVKIKKYCPEWQTCSWWICGPAGFVDGMIKLAQKMGLPKEQVNSEDFPGY